MNLGIVWENRDIMIITYHDNETRRICEYENYARKYFPPNVVTQLKQLMYRFAAYPKYEAFQVEHLIVKYRIHDLKGNKKGLTSFSLDQKRRVTVKVLVQVNEDQITIMEVSNHYGD